MRPSDWFDLGLGLRCPSLGVPRALDAHSVEELPLLTAEVHGFNLRSRTKGSKRGIDRWLTGI